MRTGAGKGGDAMFEDLQRSMTYFPDASRVRPASTWFAGGRDVLLTTDDGLDLTAWFLPAAGADRRTAVLFAPGNGGHRESRAPLFALLVRAGFSVLAMDYRGYGGNPGSPSETGLAADARAAAAYLLEIGYAPGRTIYLGESLGTGVVARLATTHRPAAIVLRSPFTSLADAAQALMGRWMPVGAFVAERYPVVDYLRTLDVPVTVIYGDADDIVPARMSAKVAASLPRLHEVLRLPGVGHNDPEMYGPPVVDAVTRLADSAIAPPRG